MSREYAVEAQRAAVLRGELTRTRARLDAALAERDDVCRRLDLLLGTSRPGPVGQRMPDALRQLNGGGNRAGRRRRGAE